MTETAPSPTESQEGALDSPPVEGPQIGDIVQGKVLQVNQENVLVDLGDGLQGAFERFEIAHWERSLEVGEEIEVLLDEPREDGWAVSVDKLEKIRVFDRIDALRKENARVKGVILRRVRGGLSVDIGVRAFLPLRESGIPDSDLDRIIGRTIACQIQRFDAKRNSIVLTRRALAQQERKTARDELFSKISVGDTVTGTVRNIMGFGAFLDLGGGDGLLHVTEMSWDRVGHPSDVVSVGDTLRVKVISIDPERDRIGLSLKDLQTNPWDEISERFPVGERFKGSVVSVAEFGAFVRLDEGVEGLVHISEVSWDRNVRNAGDIFQEGQEIEVVVLGVDVTRQRISLSHKRLTPSPWEQALEDLKAGDIFDGKITNVTDFGVFVEVRPGVEGLVHVSDMSWKDRIEKPSAFRDFKEGDECRVRILNIDTERQRIALGIKQLTRDPWEDARSSLEEGAILDVTVTRVTPYGAFASITEDVEGLIHVSEASNERVDRIEDALPVGKTVKAMVLKIDERSRKVSLSVKAFLERDTMREFIDNAQGESSLAAALRAKGLVSESEQAPTEDATPEENETSDASA